MKTTFATLVLFLAFPFASAQTPLDEKAQQRAVFDSFYRSLDKLPSMMGTRFDRNKTARAVIRRTNEKVKSLDAIASWDKPIPKDYLENLNLDAELLRQHAVRRVTSKSQQTELLSVLRDIDSDLAIKLASVQRGSNGGLQLVQVIVHAKRGDQEVSAYEVWYVPRAWVKVSTAFKRFDRLTDPTNPPSMNLAPGNYLMWLRKGQPVTGQQPVSVNGAGGLRREIDFIVP